MSTRIKLTVAVMDLLDALLAAPPDSPPWGLQLCDMTGRSPGTVYPALDRLMKAGWIEDWWEDPPPEDRPRRRYYGITSVGRAGYSTALDEREARKQRWARGVLLPGRTV
jgi:DNA-binding MarR family transcriptional regulator